MNKNDLKIQAARAALWWRSRPGPVGKLIRARVRPPMRAGQSGVLRAAAVQVRARLYQSAWEFAEKMESLVRTAYMDGATLIAFPEDNGTQLLGMLPGFQDLANGADMAEAGGPDGIAPGDVFRFVAPYARRAFLATFGELARAYAVTIVSGSIRLPAEDGRLVNVAYCFGPDGSILGSQEKLHLMPVEERWGFVPGHDLTVLGRDDYGLAFPICHDATFFETFRVAAADGADVVVVQAANPEEYNQWYALRGIWPRVQESGVYGIASHLVGDFLGLRLTGRSGLYAPLDLTPAVDGVLAQASDHSSEEVVVADLNLAALADWRRRNPRPLPVEEILRRLPESYKKGILLRQGRAEEHGQDGRDEQWGKQLAEDQDKECPAPAQPVADVEAEVEKDEAPAVKEEEQRAEKIEGQEESGQREQVGDLGVPENEQIDPERNAAAGEAAENGQDE